MVLNFCIPSPLQHVSHTLLYKKGLTLWVKRDDLIHPQVSGNKWRKLKYNVEAAKKQKKTQILTFGGAFSNHIYATAAAGQLVGLETIGAIRGELTLPLNETLTFAHQCGMEVFYLDRNQYAHKNEVVFMEEIQEKYPNAWIVPEGGANWEGYLGCKEILPEISEPFDVVLVACGTGTTMAGLVGSASPDTNVIGVPVLKGGEYLAREIQHWLEQDGVSHSNWELNLDFHFGGYAKKTTELMDFMSNFTQETGIPLEFVYTGKLFFALWNLIISDYFPKGTRILVVHTGGMR